MTKLMQQALRIGLVIFAVALCGSLALEKLSEAVDSGVLGRSMTDPRCPVCNKPAEALINGEYCYSCAGWD